MHFLPLFHSRPFTKWDSKSSKKGSKGRGFREKVIKNLDFCCAFKKHFLFLQPKFVIKWNKQYLNLYYWKKHETS